jgi:hypothetical protein
MISGNSQFINCIGACENHTHLRLLTLLCSLQSGAGVRSATFNRCAPPIGKTGLVALWSPQPIFPHSCPKQVLSASFSQPNPLICNGADGHRKTRSMTARGSCPERCRARTREAETRNWLKHGVLRPFRSYSLRGERLRPFAACPKRDRRKAVLDKTVARTLRSK